MPAGMMLRDLTLGSQRREGGRYVDKGGCLTVAVTDDLLPDDPPRHENQSPPDDELILDENQILFHREDRRYRIRGLEKNALVCTLKVALMVSRDSLIHLDSLDLVKAANRNSRAKARGCFRSKGLAMEGIVGADRRSLTPGRSEERVDLSQGRSEWRPTTRRSECPRGALLVGSEPHGENSTSSAAPDGLSPEAHLQAIDRARRPLRPRVLTRLIS